MDTIVVFTVIWDSIVNWVIFFLFWVLILVATRRGANWVILNLKKRLFLGVSRWKGPCTISILNWGPGAVFSFLLGDVSLSINNILISTEIWYKVISWWSLWTSKRSRHNMTECLFRSNIISLGVGNINVFSSEVWNL